MKLEAFIVMAGLACFWMECESNRFCCEAIENLNQKFKVYVEYDSPPDGDKTMPRGGIVGGETYDSEMVRLEDSASWLEARYAGIACILLYGVFIFAPEAAEFIQDELSRWQCKVKWRSALITVSVSAAIITGLYFGQLAVQDWAIDVITSAYDPARNPDFAAEAGWKAMSWGEKRACRQKFEAGLARRKFRSEQFQVTAVFMQIGILATGLLGVAIVIAGSIQRKESPDDPATQY